MADAAAVRASEWSPRWRHTVLRGETDDEVVESAQAHARTVHDMELEREQAQAMVRPA